MTTLSDAKATECMNDDLSTGVPSHSRDDLERKLLRKLDLRMSIIIVLYALNFVSLSHRRILSVCNFVLTAYHGQVDRANASSARLATFEQDLHLQGNQYARILSIVYVGYILMQVPANMVLHWLEKPSILIPGSMVIWGLVSTLTGFYTGILLARFFLGFVEAPFYPGVLYLISGWYKRDELAVRTTLVTCGSVLASGFGAVFASGILTGMQGKLGQAAWRWLFYIEGGATILVAICAFSILPDFPHNTKWLTPEERALAISRLAADGTDELGKRTTMQGLRDAVCDWKVWWFSVALTIQFVALSFVIYFPTIVATLGYDTTNTLLLCAPPWVFSTIVAFVISRYSDKAQKRYVFLLASSALAGVGFIISICTMNTAARYTSVFLMAQISAAYMVIWGWINNIFAREPAKRAVAIALINGLSQTGNIIGAYVWPINWGPTYRYSYAICLAALGGSTSMFGVMYLHLKRVNERIERDERNAKDINNLPNPVGFRYLV
ncbi:major facilitator superfamily domain-containing protein [Suillus subalutaceus]|uniref:major facilitator superfamily domain-containing protein n=1 Tax=Suillus subalutaceus TaxID=48586 RepID=UPI001B8640A1|nr:major facilitator superfamily domain-containing protein [Suillus subalutaceus]KAG1854211.1 major facilitator superfamily domain-containing protein [Suillus subalutaceus]